MNRVSQEKLMRSVWYSVTGCCQKNTIQTHSQFYLIRIEEFNSSKSTSLKWASSSGLITHCHDSVVSGRMFLFQLWTHTPIWMNQSRSVSSVQIYIMSDRSPVLESHITTTRRTSLNRKPCVSLGQIHTALCRWQWKIQVTVDRKMQTDLKYFGEKRGKNVKQISFIDFLNKVI